MYHVVFQVSGTRDGLEVSHLIPKTEGAWFSDNEMGIYNSSPLLPDRFLVSDIRNCWLLRANIHRVFDDRTFVLVPKAGTIVNHFLVQTSVLGKIFHNRQPSQLSVAPEFLFARLAWTVIPLGISFTNSAGRRIIIFNVEHQAYETITLRPQNETITLPPQTSQQCLLQST